MYRQSVGKKNKADTFIRPFFALRSVKPAFILRMNIRQEKRIPRRTDNNNNNNNNILRQKVKGFAGSSVAAIQVPRQRSLDAGARAIPSSRDRYPAHDEAYMNKR